MADDRSDRLEGALAAASGGDQMRGEVLDLLRDARLYVLGQRVDPSGAHQAGGKSESMGSGDREFRLRTLVTESGPVLPAFTSKALMESSTQLSQSWLLLPSQAVMAGAGPEAKVVLNPGTPLVYELGQDEVRSLADRATNAPAATVAPAGESVFLGLPADRPDVLLGHLHDHLRTERAVRRAYSGQIYRASDGYPPHPLIGIEMTAGHEVSPVMDRISSVAADSSDLPVDLVLVDGSGVGRWLTANGEQFYDAGTSS